MKIIGHIFDPPIHQDLTVMDPEFHLETSPVLWWIAAMYYERIVSTNHGIWDNTLDDPSIADWNRIDENYQYEIECDATGISFYVKVHPVEKLFEVWQHNEHHYEWRVVFRLVGEGSRFKDWKKLHIDVVDGDRAACLRYFMLLKLSGETPSFQLLG